MAHAVAPPSEAEWAVLSWNRVVIFVTVGAQMPFDRMVRAVEQWAVSRSRSDVFAQIGQTDYCPSGIHWTKFMDPVEFKYRFESAKVIVAHAGTGSIITALRLGKPILIMPRRANLRETRNDHQVATATQFRHFPSVTVAWDEIELLARLERIDDLHGSQSVGSHASPELITAIRDFIDGATNSAS